MMSAMGRAPTAKEDLASRRRYAALRGESFDGSDLVSARPQELSFTRCSFRDADLSGVSLPGATFAGCDLTGADLRSADLTGARFGRLLTGTTGIKLDHAVLRDLQLEGVIPRSGTGRRRGRWLRRLGGGSNGSGRRRGRSAAR
ncbi:pentapeptide repeat-containing protein [Streptomyces sp. LaPpAH-108]|uniref:pentapeptide repeat-containing protein n=1 Tax=Streptomyces sp. LaPpAH-108 TaxID=1155714 RepID=UPI002D21C3FD|nr:pentapeptide repeat-containing protein [Streptomyces sp. LaPpAH-108]